MKITGDLPQIGQKNPISPKQTSLNFGQLLKNAINGVNSQIHHAEQAAEMLMLGEIEFHDAMIATEKANLALQLTLAIRNKIQEAYQEIMRIQV